MINMNNNKNGLDSSTSLLSSALTSVSNDPQNIFSGFNAEKVGGKPCSYYSLKKVLKTLRTKCPTASDTPTKKRWGIINQTITWSGIFTPQRCPEYLTGFSGLICIGFYGLSSDRLIKLRSALEADPYSYIVFDYPSDAGFKVVVRIHCNSVNDYESYFLLLSEYYQSTYGVMANELDEGAKDVCQLCYLPYDPHFYCNEESTRLTLPNHNPLPLLDAEHFSEDRNKEIARKNDQEILIIDDSVQCIQPDVDSSSSNTDTISLMENRLNVVQHNQPSNDVYIQQMLNELELTEQYIKEKARQPILRRAPLISRNGVSIIRPNTVNVIQGKYAQHKSRLAELLIACLLANSESMSDFAGFEKAIDELFICYFDTERNTDEECPDALQRIKRTAGYLIAENLPNFRCISLKKAERDKRLNIIEACLAKLRQSTSKHLFVVLDVITDCLSSFNDLSQSMKLIDLLNNLCESYNATFLVLIHENPTNEKARGHIGTEIANKASTVMQISTDKEGKGTADKLIKLKFLKLRADKVPDDIYFQLDPVTKQLILAEDNLINQLQENTKADDLKSIAEELESLLIDGPMAKREVYDHLMEVTDLGDSSIRTKVKRIIKQAYPLKDTFGQQFILTEPNNQQFSLELLP